MSILDLGFDDTDALIKDIEGAMPVMDAVIEGLGLSDSSAVQSVRNGISPHIVLGLSNEELDAIFVTGLNCMQAGDVPQAQAIFLKLVTFKAIDYRFWYALGTTFQIEEQLPEAARAYMMSLGLKATDVDGYLRLGECLLAANELPEALDCFQTAWALCVDGHGSEDQRQVAERLTTHTNQRMDPDGSDANGTPTKGSKHG